jgi:magnesium transporter
MLMLSELERFEIADENGARARFADLAAPLLDTDYPIVNNLFFRVDKKTLRLPWEAVRAIDREKRQILVSNFDQAEEVSLEPQKDYVLLKYEILDALLLDLQNRRAIRANDLQLEEEDGLLLLKAADASIEAILRRISFGFYRRVGEGGLFDWKYVEFLRGDPKAVHNGAGYHLRITRMPPGEIARLCNFIPYLHAAELITLLPDAKAVKTLEIMTIRRQLQIFEELEEEQVVRLLALMAPDTAADLLGLLQTEMMKNYLEKIPQKKSRRIIELLRYPEETVGAIMTNDIAYLPAELTVVKARRQLRERFQNTDFVYFIYIVDDEENRSLSGMISLRDLFASRDEQTLEEIMDPYISTLSALEEVEKGAYRVVESQLAAMPVTGKGKKLLGAVTIDAAIMAVAPEDKSENLRIFS